MSGRRDEQAASGGLGVPIEGQSHWCDGFTKREEWGVHPKRYPCGNVVRNDHERCAAGHYNRLRPLSTVGAEIVRQELPAAGERLGVEDVALTYKEGVDSSRAISADAPLSSPDMSKIERLVGRSDYGVAFCLSPWPDGGWQAGLQVTDSERVEKQVELGILLPGLLTLSDADPAIKWDIFEGFKNGINEHGSTPAEAVDALFNTIVARHTGARDGHVDPHWSSDIVCKDSPRWCDNCQAWGDHHTDRHPPVASSLTASEVDWNSRFQEVWLYCLMDHRQATLRSGPCNECIMAYATSGPPDGKWNANPGSTMALPKEPSRLRKIFPRRHKFLD